MGKPRGDSLIRSNFDRFVKTLGNYQGGIRAPTFLLRSTSSSQLSKPDPRHSEHRNNLDETNQNLQDGCRVGCLRNFDYHPLPAHRRLHCGWMWNGPLHQHLSDDPWGYSWAYTRLLPALCLLRP